MRILIAEDEPVSRRRLEAFLQKWGYTVLVTVDGADALRVLAQPDSPTLVVLDRMMPHIDGLEVCRRIRTISAERYVYVILLTANGHQNEIIEGFEAGADDYITKPFELSELKARVRTGARIVQLHEELIAAREQLRIEATHDSLTGLLNRTAFFDSLSKAVARARRHKTPLAIIMADLDQFKQINDTCGHLVGDFVLRETAARLRASLRASDIIGRFGGEEFVVAVPEVDLPAVMALAERVRESICQRPFDAPDRRIAVTMSLGVTATSNMEQSGRLLDVADRALYEAKRDGRNRVAVELLEPMHEVARGDAGGS